jgi:hypothetical protein
MSSTGALVDGWRARGGVVEAKSVGQSARDRVEGYLIVGLVVLVQVAWASALVYLVLHFL